MTASPLHIKGSSLSSSSSRLYHFLHTFFFHRDLQVYTLSTSICPTPFKPRHITTLHSSPRFLLPIHFIYTEHLVRATFVSPIHGPLHPCPSPKGFRFSPLLRHASSSIHFHRVILPFGVLSSDQHYFSALHPTQLFTHLHLHPNPPQLNRSRHALLRPSPLLPKTHSTQTRPTPSYTYPTQSPSFP